MQQDKLEVTFLLEIVPTPRGDLSSVNFTYENTQGSLAAVATRSFSNPCMLILRCPTSKTLCRDRGTCLLYMYLKQPCPLILCFGKTSEFLHMCFQQIT